MGILLLHAHGNFGIGQPSGREVVSLPALDQLADQFVYFLINNKAFAVFSIMFGFSFFLQMKKNGENREEFTKVFGKRLFFLLLIGYLNAMVFRADILTKYAMMGFLLLVLHKLNTRILLMVAILLLIQIPEWVQFIKSMGDAGYEIAERRNEPLWDEIQKISMAGSFFELLRINMGDAFLEVWKLNFSSGRIYNILGYFLLGFLLGRSCFLNNLKSCRKIYLFVLTGASVLYLGLRHLRNLLPNYDNFSGESLGLLDSLFTGYMDFLMVAIIMSVFVLLYQLQSFKVLLNILTPYGRMSLTSYILQGFIGVFLYYGFGLGLYNFLGSGLNLAVAALIFLTLLAFSSIWFRYFLYGPLEYLWRGLTHNNFNYPLKRNA